MAVYNGEKFIGKQLDSLINQTYSIYELIIQDDLSTDNTFNIIEEYACQYPFIHIFQNESRKGINENFYSAMEKATGDYIAICDQDDEWEPEKIELQVKHIGENNWLCGCFSKPFSETGAWSFDNRIPNCSIERLIHISSALPGHTQMFKREILPLVLRFRDMPILYDHLISIIAASYQKIIFIDKPLVNHRMYHASATFTVPIMNPTGKGNRNLPNIMRSFFRTFRIYIEIRPQIRQWFMMINQILQSLPAENAEIKDALKVVKYQSQRGIISYIKLTFMYLKLRKKIFHVEEKNTILSILRAGYFPISCSDYFRYMAKAYTNK
jgi:glycosyltransferase involved in cell wall biosynthesis